MNNIENKLDEILSTMKSLDQRLKKLENLEKKFENLETKMQEYDTKFEEIESEQDHQDEKITNLEDVVVVWRGISSKTDGRTKAEGLSFYHPGHQTAWVRC